MGSHNYYSMLYRKRVVTIIVVYYIGNVGERLSM